MSIFGSFVELVLQWDNIFVDDEFDPETYRIFVAATISAMVIVFAIELLLWFYTAHRASKIAKWILISISVASLVSWAVDYTGYEGTDLVFYAASKTLAFVAFALLFRSDARLWFASKGAISLEKDTDLEDVFK
ncbi:hypothetical protein [Parasphingorhabdus sp.]|uniref:hypothetical protein n=1 Tax=Parasphingorhabdus sp. TaxID=2709688 RepID=UPI00326386E8